MGFGEGVLILFSICWGWRAAVWMQVQLLALSQPALALVSPPETSAPFALALTALPEPAPPQPAFSVSARP